MRNTRIATFVLGLLVVAGCQTNGVVATGEQTSQAPSATTTHEPTPQPFATQKPGTVALVGKVACEPGVPLHGLWLTHDGSTNPPAGHPHVERLPNDSSQAVYWEDFWPIGLSYRLNVMCGTRPDGNALSDFFTLPQNSTSILVDCKQGLRTPNCVVSEYKP